MKEISLTQGRVSLVDDDMFEYLNQWKWNYSNGYATRLSGKRPNRKHTRMSRVIMQPPDEMEIDHRDRNTINNQRLNLRICTHSENMMNQGKPRDNKSGFKGVTWNKSRKKWQAQISTHKRTFYLGCFADPETAAYAYDIAAKKLFGEYANLNFR